MTQKEKQGRSPIKRVRVPKHIERQWLKFCEEKEITLSEFLRYAGNLLILRPELWENPQAGKQTGLEKIEHQLRELKTLISSQKQQIEEVNVKMSHIDKIDRIKEELAAQEVLKHRILSILDERGTSMTLDELRKELSVSGPELQKFIFPTKGKAFCALDDVLTLLLNEELIKYDLKTKHYSSASL